MKQFIIITLFTMLLTSCGGGGGSPSGSTIEPVVVSEGYSAYSVCRHEALIAAIMYEEAGYETRLMYGPYNDTDGYHIQAQALISGEWKWLKVLRHIQVNVGHQENFEPEKIYDCDTVYENEMAGVWY